MAKEWFGWTGCLSCYHLSHPGHVFMPDFIEFLICKGKKILRRKWNYVQYVLADIQLMNNNIVFMAENFSAQCCPFTM